MSRTTIAVILVLLGLTLTAVVGDLVIGRVVTAGTSKGIVEVGSLQTNGLSVKAWQIRAKGQSCMLVLFSQAPVRRAPLHINCK
jgi:hypothetical protein